jgi:lysozyme family protein
METTTIICPKILADVLVSLGIAKLPEATKQPEPVKPKEFTVTDIQKALNEHFDAQLVVDGKLGPKTSAAIRRAEEFLKLPVDGSPDLALSEAFELLDGLVFDFTPVVKTEGGLATTDFEQLKAEYQRMWDTCVIKNPKVVQAACASMLANRARYEEITAINGIPWEDIAVVHRMECGGRFDIPWEDIAVVHRMECGGRFDRHLHCGDPLTARTVRVPKGRPVKGEPPFTWKESALDALEKRAQNKDWSIPRRLWIWEAFNGWGYRTGAGRNTTPPRTSPYLTAGTNLYTKGKYTSDGVFDPEAVSQQIGVIALLKGLGCV